jgi:hypothetical protein
MEYYSNLKIINCVKLGFGLEIINECVGFEISIRERFNLILMNRYFSWNLRSKLFKKRF